MKNKRENDLRKNKMNSGELALKLGIAFFCLTIYIVLFICLNGVNFFESALYTDNFAHNEFQIHTIDVENGDCFLIKLPENRTMMIDCGDEKYSDRVESYVRKYMRVEDVEKIDYLILTHSDSDHVGGAENIIKKFNVKNVYRPKKYSLNEGKYIQTDEGYAEETGLLYDKAIIAAYEKNCNIFFNEKGMRIELKNTVIEILSPSEDYYSEDNDYSAVVMIEYNGIKSLFMGDAGADIEARLIVEYGNKMKADILKVGHHGSKSSTSQEFLQVVNPQIAILSCADNSSVLPSMQIIDRLKSYGCDIATTIDYGNFAISVVDDDIVCQKAENKFNYWAVALAVGIVAGLILWKIPIDLKKGVKKTK